MHGLDNVIWQALTTRQAEFAEAFGEARRFAPDVSVLTAFRKPNAEGYTSLAALAGSGGTAALFLDHPFQVHDGWRVVGGAPLLQMFCENGTGHSVRNRPATQITELGPLDSGEMLELTALTKPGPFGCRTHQLGTYLGIRRDRKLVAMAGERLKVPGYTEVSAVCTHAEHLGKGYAGTLMSEVMRRIRERREIPFLHVRQDNTRAIALYERLGFQTRRRLHFVVLRKEYREGQTADSSVG
jgi:ribosomal protein S18 acetylase RimI-like enzyme